MILEIKRFIAKRRLETTYDILNFYEKKKDIIGILEYPTMVVAKSQVGWLLKHWKTYGRT